MEDTNLVSRVNGRRYAIGELERVSLGELRARAHAAGGQLGRLRVGVVQGDVRKMHQSPGRPVAQLRDMRNGYALCTRSGLDAISACLESSDATQAVRLGDRLRIGLHWDIEVTDAPLGAGPRVSQAFCSALPVAYGRVPSAHWRVFASVILRAAYEAAMWAGLCNTRRAGSSTVLLTRLGGGAFGNDEAWIQDAMRSALEKLQGHDLNVRLVSYGPPSAALMDLVAEFS